MIRGVYEHFRGGLYWVIGVARHTDTGEELVIYRPLDGTPSGECEFHTLVRVMFEEQVRPDVPRFRFRPDLTLV